MVDIYAGDAMANSMTTNSQNRARHVGYVDIPGLVLPTSNKSVAGDDEEWKRQIDYWEAWSGAVGMEGMDTYPRPRA